MNLNAVHARFFQSPDGPASLSGIGNGNLMKGRRSPVKDGSATNNPWTNQNSRVNFDSPFIQFPEEASQVPDLVTPLATRAGRALALVQLRWTCMSHKPGMTNPFSPFITLTPGGIRTVAAQSSNALSGNRQCHPRLRGCAATVNDGDVRQNET